MLTRIVDSLPPTSGHGHSNCWNARPCVERTTTDVKRDLAQKRKSPQNCNYYILSMKAKKLFEVKELCLCLTVNYNDCRWRICSIQGQYVSQGDEAAQCEDGSGNAPTQRVVAQIPEREREIENQRCEQITMYACLYLQVYMYVCVCACMCIHILILAHVILIFYKWVEHTSWITIHQISTQSFASSTLKKDGKDFKTIKSTLDANIIIESVQGPKALLYTYIVTLSTSSYLQIDQIIAAPQAVGDASIQQIVIQISEEKKPTPTFMLSSRCHDEEANPINVIDRSFAHHLTIVFINICMEVSSTSMIRTSTRYMWSVWYTNVWSLAFITIVYFDSPKTNARFGSHEIPIQASKRLRNLTA